MRGWWIEDVGPVGADRGPLRFGERADPEPGPHEVLVRVSVCGVCRTDLHLAEGDLPPRQPRTIPGHEVVGVVERRGLGASRFQLGQRVGIAWLRSTCGECRFCMRGDENLCVRPAFTGWDADGGYAELAAIHEDYAYELPDVFDDATAAPLLCAGIIGFRALKRAALPPGGRLGVYGFGGSAHLAVQVAIHQGATVHVLTRSPAAQRLAMELGAASAGEAAAGPPERLDSAIVFAPSGDIVPLALRALDRGGTVAIAGIHLTDVPPLRYATELFEERQLRSVMANTRRDGEEFLAIAAEIPLRPTVVMYPFEQADRALADLATGRVTGAAVIDVAGRSTENP